MYSRFVDGALMWGRGHCENRQETSNSLEMPLEGNGVDLAGETPVIDSEALVLVRCRRILITAPWQCDLSLDSDLTRLAWRRDQWVEPCLSSEEGSAGFTVR